MRNYCIHFNQFKFYRAPIWPMFMNSIGCQFKMFHLDHSLTGNATFPLTPPGKNNPQNNGEQNRKQISWMIWPIQPRFKKSQWPQQIISYKTILYLFPYTNITLKFNWSSLTHKIIAICMYLCTIYCKSIHNYNV